MFFTYGKIKKMIARYAGNGGLCPSSEEVDIFTLRVLDKVLKEGDTANLRKFCFHAVKGCITLPYELDTPIKVKIDDYNLAKVWSKWTEYYTQETLRDGTAADAALYEDPNSYATIYDLQAPSQIGALAISKEDEGAYLIVQGVDATGREIITQHNGETVFGEYVPLRQSVTKITQNKFAKITGVTKSRTSGSVQLYAVDLERQTRLYLSEYAPYEEVADFRRARLLLKCPDLCKVSVLGRIRLKPYYHDNEVIPFDNINTIVFAAQTLNAINSSDMQTAATLQTLVTDNVEKDNNYKRVGSGQPLDVLRVLSAGNVTNVISNGNTYKRYNQRY